MPLIELELEGALEDDDPGVVDERVDSTESFGEGGDARSCFILRAQVDGAGMAGTARRLDLIPE